MLCNFEITPVIQQTIKYVSGVPHAANHFGIKRAVLIRYMRTNLHSRLQIIFQIDLTCITPVAVRSISCCSYEGSVIQRFQVDTPAVDGHLPALGKIFTCKAHKKCPEVIA